MLSIGAVTTGSVGYYERDVTRGDGVRAAAYYQQETEPKGQWTGAGAEALGLVGALGDGDLATLLAGTVPCTGEQLGNASGKSLGLDLTFSAPKSVSVAAYLLDAATHAQVLAAHTAAVHAAVGWLEAEAAVVRRGQGGATEHRASGLVGARFDHATSRDLDPQLHSHVVISALAAGPDGRYTKLHARQLYRCAATAGHLYQAALRAELTHRLGVGWTPVVKGQAEIVGMDPALLAEFSSRRQAIEAETARIVAAARADNADRIVAGKPPQPVPAGRALWEQATLATRSVKDHHAAADLAALVPAWRDRARELGHELCTDQFLAELRAAAQPTGRTTWAEFAARLAGPDGLTATRSWVDRRDVIRAVAAELHHFDPAELQLGEDAAEAAGRLADAWCTEHGVALHSGDQASRETGRWALRYTTVSHLARERAALATILARQAETATGLGDPATAARATADLTLAAEQAAAVRVLTERGAGVDVMSAPAGAGKTRLLAAAVRAWEEAGLTVIGTSTAAKAVRELADGAGVADARTLAALLRQLDKGEHVRQLPGEDGKPRLVRVSFALSPRHVLIVDEAAMASTADLHQLLTAADGAGSKVVLCGDPQQLPSIAAGGLMATAMRDLDDPTRAGIGQPRTVRLAETRRATEEWEREAQLAWHAGRAVEALDVYEAQGRVHYGLNEDSIFTRMVGDWRVQRTELAAKHAERGEDGPAPEPLMVAHRRAQVHALNCLAREARIAAGELDGGISTDATVDLGAVGGTVVVPMCVGEPVITTVADRPLGIINGTRGVVTEVHAHGGVRLQTEAGADIDLPAGYLGAGGLLHAYALTAHRAQGTTTAAALVLADTRTMTAEWGYSAATRGRRNDLYVLSPDGEPAVADHAVQRTALLAAMSRPGDQITALDVANQQGLDLLAPGPAASGEDRVPTEADYERAARLAALAAHRAGGRRASQADIDTTASQLADSRAFSPRGTAQRGDGATVSEPAADSVKARERDLRRELSKQ